MRSGVTGAMGEQQIEQPYTPSFPSIRLNVLCFDIQTLAEPARPGSFISVREVPMFAPWMAVHMSYRQQ
jgi:hypothetical protein